MKTNRIPFTLEEYKSGKYKVVTRNGRSARIICTDFNNGRQSIVALISLRNGEESCTIFNTGGKYWNNREISDCDLFLEETVFKDGDIVAFGGMSGMYAIGIFQKLVETWHKDYVVYTCDNKLRYNEGDWSLLNMRLATDLEKEKLFDTLAKDGKRWNAEKKCIEDIKKEYQFKPFDRVLVRDDIEDLWEINFFSHKANKDEYGYRCPDCYYIYCIPYEGNEELLGTTKSPK